MRRLKHQKVVFLQQYRGKNDEEHRILTAHLDTLGAMVRAIKPDGRIKWICWVVLVILPLKVKTA